jgi:hypothetical protein
MMGIARKIVNEKICGMFFFGKEIMCNRFIWCVSIEITLTDVYGNIS